MNWKNFTLRALLGFPLGVFINYTIQIIIALCRGEFDPVPQEATIAFGSALSAVIIQYVSSGLLGAVFAGGSAVFEAERWSITRQTAVHFSMTFVATLLCSMLNRWVPLGDYGPWLVFAAIWVALYAAMWLSLMTYTRKKIARINQQIEDRSDH